MLFAFALAWLVTLPIGVIQATTNQVWPIFLKLCLFLSALLDIGNFAFNG
jgi:hypothetical protein